MSIAFGYLGTQVRTPIGDYRNYPELREQAVDLMGEALARDVAAGGYTAIGPVVAMPPQFFYARQVLDRPEWADEADPGPWWEDVLCAEDKATTVLLIAEQMVDMSEAVGG